MFENFSNKNIPKVYRIRIHECTIKLRFLGIIMRILRLQVSVHNVNINFKTLVVKGRRELNPFVELTENSKEENSLDLCPNYVQEFGLSITTEMWTQQ
jgi:hypothetical protein